MVLMDPFYKHEICHSPNLGQTPFEIVYVFEDPPPPYKVYVPAVWPKMKFTIIGVNDSGKSQPWKSIEILIKKMSLGEGFLVVCPNQATTQNMRA